MYYSMLWLEGTSSLILKFSVFVWTFYRVGKKIRWFLVLLIKNIKQYSEKFLFQDHNPPVGKDPWGIISLNISRSSFSSTSVINIVVDFISLLTNHFLASGADAWENSNVFNRSDVVSVVVWLLLFPSCLNSVELFNDSFINDVSLTLSSACFCSSSTILRFGSWSIAVWFPSVSGFLISHWNLW